MTAVSSAIVTIAPQVRTCRPDFQCDELGYSGAHQKIHRHALEEREALPCRSGADDEPKRHDARRHRKAPLQAQPEAGPNQAWFRI